MTEGPYELPKGWRWVRLGEVVAECIGGTWGTGDDPDGVGVLRPNNIGENGEIVWEDVRWRNVSVSQLQKRRLRDGDIILTKSNSLEQVGRAALFQDPNDDRTYVPSNFLQLLRPDPSIVQPKYLHYMLRTRQYVAFVQRMAIGSSASLKNLSARALEEFRFPLPPLPEQRRIVARIEELMERVREAKRLREEAQKDADRLMQAALAEVFPRPGDPLPLGWRWVRLGEVVQTLESGFAFRKKGVQNGDLPHLRPYNIGDDGSIHLDELFLIPRDKVPRNKTISLIPGDVLFNNTNSVELVGKTALVTQPMEAGFSNHFTLIRTKSDIQGAWLALALRAWWRQGFFARICNKWIGQAGINTETLKHIPIPLPPSPSRTTSHRGLFGPVTGSGGRAQESPRIHRCRTPPPGAGNFGQGVSG